MSDISLNFINNSNDANNSSIVIFQKNVAAGFNEIAVAWKVIGNCGRGDNHPFMFPVNFTVSASDSYGNMTNSLPATDGQVFEVTKSPTGTMMRRAASTGPDHIEIGNALANGSIDAQVYKAGKLLAAQTGIAPSGLAPFKFNPTIWIGVVNQVEEGDVMNSAIISDINTELSLHGITKANIIMTGGGPGETSQPFKFTLVPTV